MALLQRGQKSPVFVTHVEFVVSRCDIFCQVGNVGGQADTVAERVAEIIEDGSASPLVQYNVGDLVLALFQVDNSWYRGRVLQTSGQSVKVYFIDYGNTEIVDMKNVLRAPEFVLSIPALSTKCTVIDCTPLGSVWTEAEKKKIETMLHSGEFTIEVIDIGPDPNNITYFVKLYSLDAPNTPAFVRPAAIASQSIDYQNLEIGKEYEVFVCYVESVMKFWVQLKSQSNELESLMGDVAVCFAEDLPSSGDLMNPGKGQVCAACFSEDGAFYRGIVQNVHAESCTVFFVDYGNCEKKSTAELFTLPQLLCKLPMQAVACSYNAKDNCSVIEEKLHELVTADNPSVMIVVSGTGALGYTVTINSIEKYISTIKPLNQQAKMLNLWHTYSSLPMQVDAIYDVCLSHVNHPGHFYVQLLGNANNIDKLMQAIDEVAYSCEKLSNFHQGYPCLAKFRDECWYRGEVLAAESNKIRVVAVDFGFVEQVSSSKLRNNSNFKDQPAQAVLCSLDLNKCDEKNWSSDDIAKLLVMAGKKALVAKVSAKEGLVHQIDLYEPQNKAMNINKEFQQEKVSLSTNKVSGTLQQLTKLIHLQAVTLPPPEVSVGSKQVLCFTASKFPYIYGQVTHTQVDKVAKLQTDLNNYFDDSKHNSVTDPSIGSFCCTQYVDEGWYRGMVTSVVGNKFEITFVDFGDCIHKAANDLKILPSNLCLLPQQCLLCKIDNLPSSVPQSQVESILLNNKVEVHITRKEDSVFPTYSGDIVDRHILDKLLNKSVSRGVFQPATTITRLSQQEHQNERNQYKDLTQRKSLPNAYSYQEVSVGSTHEVTVTHVKDPGSFQVAFDKMSGSLDSLMDELEGYYSKLAPGGEQLENARVGQACVSQFTEDKGWYRALITGIKSNGQIEVLYVDYGNNEYLELESLKLIKPKFTSLPAQAIHCCLDGVISPFGFWSPEHAVQFSEMVEEKPFKATFISITREHGQIIYKVELVDQKEININKKFGTMTNTLSVATSTDFTSKPFAAFAFGQNMKVAIGGGGDNNSGFWDQSKSFGGSSKPPFGSGSPSGERNGPSFGSGRPSGDGGRPSGERPSFGSGRPLGDGGRLSGERPSFGGSSGGNRDCFKCGQSGHLSRECPNAPSHAGGGGAGRDCFKCGESGHMARDCTNPSKAGGGGAGRDCFKCGESGHMARDCTNPPKAGGGGAGRDCFKCGESGHMARDCTNPPKDGTGSRKGNQGGFGRQSSRSFAQNSKAEALDDWDTEDGGSTSQGGGFQNGDLGDAKTGGGFGAKSRGGFGAKKDTVGFGSRNSGGDFRKNISDDEGFGAKKGGFGSRNDSGDFRKNVSEDEKGISMAARNDNGRANTSRLGVKVGGFGSSRAESGEEWNTDVTVNSSKDLVSQQSIGVYSATLLDLVGSFDVYVVFTDDPEHFWCQLMKNCSSLEQLMENMNSFYNKLPEGELTIDRPQTGMPCAAKFSEDNQWYRAKILNASQQKMEVLFVDYGNSESIFTNKLRQLKCDFMELATQGIKCSLNGAKPAHLKWTPEAKQDFEDLTHDRHLVAKIINTKPDMTYLLDLENDKNTNVLEAMIEKGHCSLVDEKVSTEVEVYAKNPYLYEAIATSQDIDVRVSWIENPERFWIQPVSEEDSIYRLVDKIQELYTSGACAELKAESFSPGEPVVSLFTDDGAWYRGYVEKTIGGKCIVRFVDYGNSDSVSKESVRLCTDDLIREPAHAVLCKLQSVRPVQSDHWTTDAKDIMDNLVKDDIVKCTVVDSTNGQLIVDLVCNGKNVRNELIQAAVVKPEKELSPPVLDNLIREVTPQESLQYRNTIDLIVGAVENVYVTHTDSVASFWCQLANHAPQLDELMEQLGKFCGSSMSLVNYNNNMACGAKFSVDGSWYRAKVTAIYPDGVEVLFIDYGNTEIVPKEDICCLNKELVELAPQAFQCELEGSNNASIEMVAKFNELIGEEMVQATVLTNIGDVASVRISLPDGKVVAEELGLIAPGSLPKVLTPKSVPMTAAAAIPSVLDIVFPEPSLPSDFFSVYVAHTVNPGCFYIQRVDQEESLNEIMDKVTEFCKTSAAVVGSVKIGRAYCCKFSEDNHWYRSKVTKIEEHAVTLEFIDYGNSETTTIENIRSISSELAKTAPFAVQCCLSGIKPKGGSWCDEGITLFEELALENELTCRVVKLNEVDLVFDDVSIADSLVEKGFAVNCMNIQTNCINSYKFLQQTMPSESLNVVVSHMNSPSDFYIQRVDQEDQLHELMAQLESDFGGFGSLTPGVVSEGQAVCSKYSEDDSWYRAEVLKADLNSLTVLHVDYGNSEETTWDNVRNITEELVKAPKFAVNCSLAESECHQGKWSEEAVKYFEDVTAVKTLLCTFITPQSVKLIDDGTNLIEEILKVENAHEKSVSHKDSPTQGQYATQSVPLDSVSCFVSHVEETGTLYLQLADEENKLSSIVEQIQELESRETLDIAKVKQGQALCARFLEDNSWYRAIVEFIDNATVLVRFVDFGNCATVDQSDDLRALSEEYLFTPPLSYPCTLPGFERFSSDQVEILKDDLSVKQLTVKFLTSVPKYYVQLYIDNLDVADMLNESGNQVGEVGENVELQTGCFETDEEVLYADIDLHNKSSDVDFECIASSITELKFEDFLLEQRGEVIISHLESPSKFWVQLANNKQKLDDLLNTMFEFYDVCADKRLLLNGISKDMAVAAKYVDDESWYRARVISFDNNNVSVLFVDYGNTELVGVEYLRRLPDTFFMLPVQAIKCCLANIQPSSDDWTEDSKVTFKKLTENRVLLIDVCGVDEAGVHKVHLFDMGTSVSDILIQKDVGVQVATPVALSTKIKQVFAPDSAAHVIAKLYDAKASKAVGSYGYNLRDLEVSDSTGFVKNVVVTTVTNPTDFWCRLQDNCYEYYLDKLQDRYSESRDLLDNSNTKSKCVVYTEKGEYQRAMITDKLQDDMVKLKLVDIGTDAIISSSNVWKLKPECELYPQLAFPCTIPGLLPANSDEWSENDCQQFREILLELNQQSDLPASAKATIVSEEDGLVLVELEVDRKDIADSLAEKGIANIEKFETTFKDTFAIDRSVHNEFGTFKSMALEPDSDYTVVVSDCDDLDRLVFHSTEGLEIIEEVTKLIEKYVSDKVGGEGLPEILQGPCLMQCPDDDLWYRANVQCFGEFDDNACQVFLVDYGTTFFIPKTRLLPIPNQLMAYPAQAIICCLGEIEPIEEHWSERCHTFFREQFMDVKGQAKMLIYVNSYHNGLHEVILHSDQLKNKSVNHLLVEHGLAVPALGSQIELSFMEVGMATSFHELSISKQDSFGESSDVDDTYDPDTSCLSELDSSQFTERDIIQFTEGDTTQSTEGDNTPFTEEDTTPFTEGDTTQFTEGDTTQFTEEDTTSFTEGDTTHSTEGYNTPFTEEDTTPFTEGDITQSTEGDNTPFTEEDIASFTEGDTTQFTEGDTTQFTERDTSLFTEGDTTQSTEVDATQSENDSFCLNVGMNQGDISSIQGYNSTCSFVSETSYSTEDTTESCASCLAIGYSSKLPDKDISCLNEHDTSGFTEEDKLARNQCDTSVFTEGNSVCLIESDISRLTNGATDVDVSRSTGDMSRSTVGDTENETSQIAEDVICIDSTDNGSSILGSSNVSCIDIITNSDVSVTSYITNSETSELMDNETSSYTTDEFSCYKKSDVHMSLNTPDAACWVCEDCEVKNLVDDAVMECIHCQKEQNKHASCLDETDKNNEKSTENFMQENGVEYGETTTAQPENIPKDFDDAEEVSNDCWKTFTGPLEDNPQDFSEVREVLLEDSQKITTDLPENNPGDLNESEKVLNQQLDVDIPEGNPKDFLTAEEVLEESQKTSIDLLADNSLDMPESEKVLPEENQKLEGDIPDDNPKDFLAAEDVLLQEIKTTSTDIPDGNQSDIHCAKKVSLEESHKTTEPSEGNQKDVIASVNVSLEEFQKSTADLPEVDHKDVHDAEEVFEECQSSS